ncbi:MAG: NAD-dependent epimerase/dehydratase family protein [Chloroflexi bacterium]|nr:NAD-dependent epimerase/dehydratase family protein [Chloroflexota bacterium]
MTSTVLVTGANGFTGSNLCRRLVEQGHHVRGLVRPTSNLAALDGLKVELVLGDLTGDLPAGMLDGVDKVYNIAAMYRHQGADRDFYQVNADGTERLLEAARKAGVRRFVQCSTVGVLGNIENPPANEESPYAPGDSYQRSKMVGEQCALDYGRTHGFPVTVVRPGAIYGPGDLRFLKLFKGIDRGTFVILGGGEVFYHYVYIDDLVQGLILAGEKDEAIGEIFIVAGDQYVTVNTIARMIAEALGRSGRFLHVPLAPVMLAARVCQAVCERLNVEPPLYPRRLDFFRKHRAFDISKARRILGYEPQVSLREGIARTADWYRQNGYL